MATPQATPAVVKLPNVRLSFPSLTEQETYEGKPTGKFSATFLIPKTNKALIKEIEAAIAEAIKLKYPVKTPKGFILTLRDGDECEYDGYEDHMSLKASRKGRPLLMDSDGEILDAEDADNVLYAGCYVNATVDFNAGKDSYGKYRVWCNLRGVKFRRDGDRFSSGTPVSDDEFDDFEDDADDADDLL